jgi:branched-chain amino acid transport system ATP-binding protein
MSLLEVAGLHAGYGSGEVLHGIDLTVDEGEVVVVLGANGAGKTTTMRAIVGLIDRKGRVDVAGVPTGSFSPRQVVAAGLSLVPQGRGTFTKLTVEENLLVGAAQRRDQAQIASDVERWYSTFPVLGERRRQDAGTLSGGEQQMLAVGRALVTRPGLLLVDEMSLGLAPVIVERLLPILRRVAGEFGTSVLFVEQHVALALEISDRAYILTHGRISLEGSAAELSKRQELLAASYLGETAA